MKFRSTSRVTLVTSALLIGAFALTACATEESSEASASGSVEQKTIGVWQSQGSGDGQVETLAAIEEATDAVGWDTVVTDSAGDPQKMASTMQSLITQQVDAIFMVYANTGLVAQQLAAAEAAGIPVISVGYQAVPSDSLAAEYAPDQEEQTSLLIERMAEDLPDGGSVAPLAVAGYYGIDIEVDTLEEEGPDHGFEPLERIDVPVTDIFAGTTSAAVDVLNGNPDLAAFFPALDIGVQTVVPALEQTGRDVPIYGFSAIPGAVAMVRSDDVTLVASDGAKAGFIAVDALLGYWVDGTEIPASTPEEFAFEYAIVDDTNVPAEGEAFFPQDDFAAPFLEKWAADYGI